MANLTVSMTINPNPANVGDQITFKAVVSGGQPPYTYSWSGRSDVTTDTIICTSQETGTFNVGVTITDSSGTTTSTQMQYSVNIPSVKLAVSLQINPNTIILGQQSTFKAVVTGGNPPYSYKWSNLPTPCQSANANTVSCKPDTSGNYNINIDVSDSSIPSGSSSASSQLIVSKVSPQVLKVQLEIQPKSIKVKNKVAMKTHVSGGTKPYSYTYTGLPHPCKTDNKDHLDCSPDQKGTYNIVVNVIDSKGNTGSDSHGLDVK